jgi:Fe2+ or Zn2+ uptake regulation protein
MKDATTYILKELSKRGYRITKARIEISNILARANKPLSIGALSLCVESDAVSVYRTMALLLKEKLIEVVPGNVGIERYALLHGHHHHVVCVRCDTVVHIEAHAEPVTPKKVPGFASIDEHELTFYGTCTACV